MFLDVVFISYDEPNADENWEHLLELIPYAIRVHGIKGIPNAHIEAAKQVTTSHFFCIDADNIVDETFNFERVLDFQKNDKRVHVWGCRNPVNGLDYGYGGVKLFPTDHVEFIEEYSVDFCTSVADSVGGFKFHKEIASTTHFNTSPYNAWKSGFRECAKLASSVIVNQDEETRSRLKIWTTVGMDIKYGDYTIAGARMGVAFSKKISNTINDFSWCREKFDSEVANRDILEVIEEYDVCL